MARELELVCALWMLASVVAMPVRLRNTTFETFARHVRRGDPVVVEDFARDWPMLGWPCERFATDFPTGEMKAEYADEGSDGRVRVGDRAWFERPRTIETECSDRPNAAPHVWHVKDEAPVELRRRVQSMYRLPYFFDADAGLLNGPAMNESLEFWLSPPGAGAMPHADSYCQMTASVQLSGAKEWRMMNPGPPISSVFDRFDTQDGGIDATDKWNPTMTFTVPEGAGVVFAPYNIHSTIGSRDQCTTATTFNFFSPMPTRYLRDHLETLMNTHLGYEEECGEYWDRYAVFRVDPEELSAEEWIAWIQGAIDTNGDGTLTTAEVVRYFEVHPEGRWGRRIEHFPWYAFGRMGAYRNRPGLGEALRVTVVGDVMAYHDRNEDGEVSASELRSTIETWHTVRTRLRRVTAVLDGGSRYDEAVLAIQAIEGTTRVPESRHWWEEWQPEQPIPRLRNTTPSEFQRLFSGGSGVLVVEDALSTLGELKGWGDSCESISTRFAEHLMRREYDGKDGPPTNDQRIGDFETWSKESAPVSTRSDLGPQYAPYYWAIKEDRALLHRIGLGNELPYFMQDTPRSREIWAQSPEVWFSAPGAGALPHADGHCEATISIQLSGTKRWRVGQMLPVVPGDHEAFVDDGDINSDHWEAEWATTLRRGEAIVIPPGAIHETRNEESECAASITFQWEGPVATHYLRSQYPQLLRSGAMDDCFDHWSERMTLVSDLPRVLQAMSSTRLLSWSHCDGHGVTNEAMQKALHAVWQSYDQDESGALEPEELGAREHALEFLDVSGDGMVDFGELAASWAKFYAVYEERVRLFCMDDQ